jgi:hypothetical protein
MSMECVNLETFLRRATPYERWRAPLDPKLERAVVLSGLSIVTALLALWMLPGLLPPADSRFFLVLGSLFRAVLAGVQRVRSILIVLNLISVGVYVALLIATQGLEAGRAKWHWVAFGETVIGVLNGCILLLPVGIIAINAILLVTLVTLAVAIVLAILAALTQR